MIVKTGIVPKEEKRDSIETNKNHKQKGELLTKHNRNHFNKPVIHCLLIILIGILAYSNTFHSPFQWDENDFLVQNPVVKNLRYFWEPSRAKAGDPVYYYALKTRYIGYFSFAVNYKIHGFDVLGYHLFNMAIHLSNALVIYLLIFLTFKTPFLKASSLKENSNLIALFSALLFVSHPLQTEAVTYIYQRHASLVTCFYLFSIVFYIQWRLCFDDHRSSFFKLTFYFILSLISTIFAMKTKENAFTLPWVILIYEFFFFSGSMKNRVLRLLPWILTLTIIPLTIFGTDRPIGEVMDQIFDSSVLVRTELSREVYLFTQFRVVLTYIRLLFLPIHQNVDYDYPVYGSFFIPSVFLSFLFHLGLIGLAVYFFCRSRSTTPDLRLSSFGILWFFVTLSIESSMIPQVLTICEYRVYLPSIGWVIAISTSAWIALEKLRPRFPALEEKDYLVLSLYRHSSFPFNLFKERCLEG